MEEERQKLQRKCQQCGLEDEERRERVSVPIPVSLDNFLFSSSPSSSVPASSFPTTSEAGEGGGGAVSEGAAAVVPGGGERRRYAPPSLMVDAPV